MEYFPPGAAKTATIKPTVIPAGLNCDIELWLGPDENTVIATSGKIPFLSTGAQQTVIAPITMPETAGVYHVYVDISYQNTPVSSFISADDITISASQEWAYSLPLSTDHTKIDSPLYNFPVLLNIYYIRQIFDIIGTNYQKIAIKTPDGVECPVEVVSWNAVSKNAELWFKAPMLSNTVDTPFVFSYDNNHTDNPKVGLKGTPAAWDVWDEHFVAVYHYTEQGNGILGEFKDSTRNQHHAQGGAGAINKVPTKADWGQLFDGINDFIKIPNHMDFSVDVALGKEYLDMTAWINPTTLNFTPSSSDGYIRIMAKQETDPVLGRQGEWHWKFYKINNAVGAPAGDVTTYVFNLKPITTDRGVGAAISQPLSFEAGKWSRVSMIACPDRLKSFLNAETIENHYWNAGNGSGYTGRMVKYDSLVTAVPPYGDLITPQHGTSPVAIGAGATNGTFALDYFAGKIAEVRFSNIERSSAWRKASYYAESDQLVKYV